MKGKEDVGTQTTANSLRTAGGVARQVGYRGLYTGIEENATGLSGKAAL